MWIYSKRIIIKDAKAVRHIWTVSTLVPNNYKAQKTVFI